VIVIVIVAAPLIVIAPVIVAVHVHGNAPVDVIEHFSNRRHDATDISASC
jgi:hypothetical protein